MPNDSSLPRGDAHWVSMIEQCSGTPVRARRAGARRGIRHHLGEHLSPAETGPPSERERLRERLLAVERLLASRRANLLSEQEVERYVALDWLEWHGGTLRLTTVGRNLCIQPPLGAQQA